MANRNSYWFREEKWWYVPVSWQGYLLTLLVVLFNYMVFLAVDYYSHSAADTFYGMFPYVIGSLTILFWIASRTCREKE